MALIRKLGLPSGSPIYVGDRPAAEMSISVIAYDTSTAYSKNLSSIYESLQYNDESKISWINISGLKDIAAIKELGKLYDIHPLTIEDILNTEQPPKIEIFEAYRFLSIKAIQREKRYDHKQERSRKFFASSKKKSEQYKEIDEFMIDQVSLIIMKNVLITFQETPGGAFDDVKRRILGDIGDIRKMGMDYLIYTIMDAIVDEYFITLNHLEDDIENIEDRATKTSDDAFIQEIQDTKKYLLQMKRAISPLRDMMIKASHQNGLFLSDELKPFLQDLGEHLSQAIIMVENNREWLSTIMDVISSVLSYQLNRVMKVLATISTIFIPLTFVSGVYGMNFDFMPELRYKYGYFIVLSGMGLIAATMITFFKLRKWF